MIRAFLATLSFLAGLFAMALAIFGYSAHANKLWIGMLIFGTVWFGAIIPAHLAFGRKK